MGHAAQAWRSRVAVRNQDAGTYRGTSLIRVAGRNDDAGFHVSHFHFTQTHIHRRYFIHSHSPYPILLGRRLHTSLQSHPKSVPSSHSTAWLGSTEGSRDLSSSLSDILRTHRAESSSMSLPRLQLASGRRAAASSSQDERHVCGTISGVAAADLGGMLHRVSCRSYQARSYQAIGSWRAARSWKAAWIMVFGVGAAAEEANGSLVVRAGSRCQRDIYFSTFLIEKVKRLP